VAGVGAVGLSARFLLPLPRGGLPRLGQVNVGADRGRLDGIRRQA
jgi:hypothetical protein